MAYLKLESHTYRPYNTGKLHKTSKAAILVELFCTKIFLTKLQNEKINR